MPFHRIYCPPDLYTREEKDALAKAIMDCYKRLPKFYVIVNFIHVENDDFYIGGERSDGRFVRFLVHHLARTMITCVSSSFSPSPERH
jgi:phenylpyruvate tautomerase PptA (4-oxalocrotonate tautomerase family)